MFKFLKRTALWIVAVPVLTFLLGASMNQAVLVANHDRFPVMWNTFKSAQYEMEIERRIDSADSPEEAVQAAFNLEALKEAGYLDDTHCLMTSKTHLNALADWIDLREATYSPGDLLIDLGEKGMSYAPFIWMALVIGRLNKKEE